MKKLECDNVMNLIGAILSDEDVSGFMLIAPGQESVEFVKKSRKEKETEQ